MNRFRSLIIVIALVGLAAAGLATAKADSKPAKPASCCGESCSSTCAGGACCAE